MRSRITREGREEEGEENDKMEEGEVAGDEEEQTKNTIKTEEARSTEEY